jgi:hypothetical protein
MGRPPKSRLAGYNKRGRVWINPKIPKRFKGINLRKRLKAHEITERRLRKRGLSYKKAHKEALKVEHKGLTKKQIRIYEGKLGSIARWHPKRK